MEVSYEKLSYAIMKAHQNRDDNELQILLYQFRESYNTVLDKSKLIGILVKLLTYRNMHIKETIYAILPKICSQNSDTILLVTNTILQDLKDINPLIKCLAINTICSLPSLFEEFAEKYVIPCLDDPHSKVRKSTVNGIEKIHKKSPHLIKRFGLINRLYETIRDADPFVITSSLITLDSILASEGGVVINKNIAYYLLSRLKDFPDLQLATVLQVLTKFNPINEEDLFKELSILDPFLVHEMSGAVIVNCVELFLNLIKDYEHLKLEMIERVIPIFKKHLSNKLSKESRFHIIDFLYKKRFDSNWIEKFLDDPELFYPNGSENINKKKIQILAFLINTNNFKKVLNDLKIMCNDSRYNADIILCINLIASRSQKEISRECLKLLINLLEDTKLTEIIIKAIQDFNLKPHEDQIILLLNKLTNKININDENLPYILPILLGNYGHLMAKTIYIIENLVQNFEIYDDIAKEYILMACIKMLFKFPSKFQIVVGEVLEKSIKTKSLNIREIGINYYTLLKNDRKVLSLIINN